MPSEIEIRRQKARGRGRQNYTRRRAEVLRAAARVFRERGFGRTSLSEVATELGMDRASLYYYVGGKDELFRDVVYEAVVANTADAERIRDSGAPPPDKLRTLVHGLVRSYSEHYPFLFVYLQENLEHVAVSDSAWTTEMRDIEERHRRAVRAIVQEGIDDGTIRGTAPAWLVTRALLGLAASTARWYEPGRSTLGADVLGGFLGDVLLDGLHGGSAQTPTPLRNAEDSHHGNTTPTSSTRTATV